MIPVMPQKAEKVIIYSSKGSKIFERNVQLAESVIKEKDLASASLKAMGENQAIDFLMTVFRGDDGDMRQLAANALTEIGNMD